MTSFYESICAAYDLDIAVFRHRFEHADAKRRTQSEFEEVRALGVRGFPAVLYRSRAGLTALARGYATGPRLIEALAAKLTGE